MLKTSTAFDENKAEVFVKSFDSYFTSGVDMSNLEQPQSMHLEQKPQARELSSNGVSRQQSGNDSSGSESGDEECLLEGVPSNLSSQGKSNGASMRSSPNGGGDDSSSSGEEQSEDEIMFSVAPSNLNESKIKGGSDQIEVYSESGSNISTTPSQSSQALISVLRSRVSPIPSQNSQDLESDRWWVGETIRKEMICSRFFGVNRILAHELIGSALAGRLGEKVKQNSGLLSTLPDFTLVPQVRGLVASQLEKWLQSPALSGLARTLFSKLVKGLENVDPPLPEDVSTIQTILSMNLKANQVRYIQVTYSFRLTLLNFSPDCSPLYLI